MTRIDPVEEEILTKAIEKWGDDAQLAQTLEELAELQKAICKLWRGGTWEDVWEEMADVEIMIDQLKILSKHTSNEYKLRKLARISEKLRTGEWVPIEEIQLYQAVHILEEVGKKKFLEKLEEGKRSGE